MGEPRDVDAPAAGVDSLCTAPDLVVGDHVVGVDGDIERGVHGQGDDRIHTATVRRADICGLGS